MRCASKKEQNSCGYTYILLIQYTHRVHYALSTVHLYTIPALLFIIMRALNNNLRWDFADDERFFVHSISMLVHTAQCITATDTEEEWMEERKHKSGKMWQKHNVKSLRCARTVRLVHNLKTRMLISSWCVKYVHTHEYAWDAKSAHIKSVSLLNRSTTRERKQNQITLCVWVSVCTNKHAYVCIHYT